MRLGLVVITAAFAPLIAAGASAQVAYGVAKTPGVTIHPAPAAPRPGPAPPPSRPSRGHGRADMPLPEGTSPRRSDGTGGDLFLAGPHAYSPHRTKRSHLRTPFYVSPYALSVPYFLPGEYPVALTSSVSAPASYSAYVPPEAGYLVVRVEPRTAMVYVDGFFVGSAAEMAAQGYPLEAGPHRVELRAEEFETAIFDVRIRANATITYTKNLERPAPATSAVEPVVVHQAATTKPLYVIPRCYAGDRRPAASELPEHCRLADLRIIR